MGKGSALVKDVSSTYDSSNNTLKVVHKRKHYFLDTSSLMLNPLGLFKLASCKIDDSIVPVKTYKNIASVLDTVNKDVDSESPNNVYISEMVEWELNNIKDTEEEFDAVRQAREVIGVLRHIKKYGDARGESLTQGITLPNGAKIYSVPHDESLFMQKNIQRYEPTRDDRILFDYFRVPTNSLTDIIKSRGLKHLFQKQNIVIPKDAFREIITEDNNFEGAVYDMKGKTGIKFSCNSLKSERTRHPNPAEKYTGVYQRPIILNPEDYSWAMDMKNNKRLISIDELTAKATNVDDFKDLDSIVMNQFVNIQSSEMHVVSDTPIGFFLRRQSADYFSYLKFSTEFIEEEYGTKKTVSRPVERKSLVPEYTTDKNKLRGILSNPSFNKNQRKSLHRLIKNASEDEDFIEINARLTSYLQHNHSASGKSGTSSSSISRQQLLDTRFNPEVIPVDEQILFVEYLNDPGIGLVSLLAPQGAGKTIFALESGLRQVRLGLYDKIIYVRPVVVTGEDTGYNPGKPAEKIKPLMMSCEDAIAKAYSFSESQKFYNDYPTYKIPDTTAFINGLFEKNILDYQVLTNMAGRTLARSFIIMDEAHLLNREQLRLFLGRTGETSKVVLLGDYAQLGAANADVVRKYGLTPDKLGMSHLIEKVLVNNNKEYTDIYGHISINRPFTKRSRVAGIGNIL